MEKIRPSAIIDIIHSAEQLKADLSQYKEPVKMNCQKCGFVSSNQICKACSLLTSLNKGKPI